MQKTQLMTLEAGERVQAFLQANAETIGKAVTPTQRAQLDAALTSPFARA